MFDAEHSQAHRETLVFGHLDCCFHVGEPNSLVTVDAPNRILVVKMHFSMNLNFEMNYIATTWSGNVAKIVAKILHYGKKVQISKEIWIFISQSSLIRLRLKFGSKNF